MVKGAVLCLNGGRAVGAAPLPLVMDVLTYYFFVRRCLTVDDRTLTPTH